MPREGSAGATETWRFRLSGQGARLDGSHPDETPVPNEHIVDVEWFRTEFSVAWRFAPPQWDVELAVPYDVKIVEARYELPDGTRFDNPEGDLHHRDETLEGFADLRLMFGYREADAFLEKDFFRVAAGCTIPVGRIEEDPYELGDLGLPHQHIQFGTGTFDPLLRVEYVYHPETFGFEVFAGLDVPVYENRKGYRGAALFDASLGPRVRVADWMNLSVRYVVNYQGHAEWDGETDPSSGYVLHALSLVVPIRLSQWTISVTALRTLAIRTQGDDSFDLDWMVGISISLGVE